MGGVFDPTRVVDRRAEVARFDEFVRADCGPRLMTIHAPPNHGKSLLLELLEYRVNYETKIKDRRLDAVRIVLPDQPNRDALVDQLAEQLGTVGVPLSHFQRVSDEFFDASFGAKVVVTQNIYRSHIGGSATGVSGLDRTSLEPPPLSGNWSTHPTYRRRLAAALIDDLRQACTERTVVVLIDQFEKAGRAADVTQWVFAFIENSVFVDPAPHAGLVVVIASSADQGVIPAPRLEKLAGEHFGGPRVLAIEKLSTFERGDVRRLCEMFGAQVNERMIDGATEYLASGGMHVGALAALFSSASGGNHRE